MNSIEGLEAADTWMGEGMELARRLLAYADVLRSEMLDSGTKADVADDLDSIIRKGWNPCEQPR